MQTITTTLCGKIATTLFATLCLGGIAAMFSQTELLPPAAAKRQGEHSTAANPSPRESHAWGTVVPAALEESVRLHLEPASKPDAEEPRLRLR